VVDDRLALDLVGVLIDQTGVLDTHRAGGERLDLHEGIEAWHCSIGMSHEGQVVCVEVDLVVAEEATATTLARGGGGVVPRVLTGQAGPGPPEVPHLLQPSLPLLVLCRPR
jgi:hypothetical protein